MDKHTLTALQGSITKWEAIVAGTGIDYGAKNCPLCEKFLCQAGLASCTGCPVYLKSGRTGCSNTPHDAWVEHHDQTEDHPLGPAKVICPKCLELAQAELEFLKSLLP